MSLAAHARDSHRNAAAALNDIRTHGARSALQTLYNDQAQWDVAIDRAGKGDSIWLAALEKLRPVSDAGAAEEIDGALFMALKSAPTKVLGILQRDHLTRIDTVCSGGMIFDVSRKTVIRLLRQRVDAVNETRPIDWPARRQCLGFLNVSIEGLLRR